MKERELILKEILSISKENPHGRYIVAPRVGKTKMAIEIIKQRNPKNILWVTPLSELATIEIPKEFETWKAKKFLPRLTTTTWMSLNTKIGHYDLVILDEEQCITENNIVNFFNGKLTYGSIVSMTGTPTKDYSKKEIYKKLSLFPVYTMLINDAVDKNILSDYQINVVEVPLSIEENIEVKIKDKTFKTSEVKQYGYYHDRAEREILNGSKNIKFAVLKRLRLIYDNESKIAIAKKLVDNLEGRKLVFTATSKQADELSENSYHSKTDGSNLRKFIDGKINVLSLVNKGGTGVTYHNVDHIIITQIDSDHNGSTTQKISRALLKQKKYKASIWLLYLRNTKDETWLKSVLSNFDSSKIVKFTTEDIANILKQNKKW